MCYKLENINQEVNKNQGIKFIFFLFNNLFDFFNIALYCIEIYGYWIYHV